MTSSLVRNSEFSLDPVARQKIKKAIGKRVLFKYPGSEGRKTGVIKDRVVIRSGGGRTGVRYWDVVDLIEFPKEPDTHWMRIGYYRQIGNRIRWASQTTICEPLRNWKRLFRAAAKKEWFRRLFQ